jgi:phosphatidylinositol-3-phosphatase
VTAAAAAAGDEAQAIAWSTRYRSMRRAPATKWISAAALLVLVAAATSCLPNPPPAHVVIVIEENHSGSSIIGNAAAPYMNTLAQGGGQFSEYYGVTHPSLPNYLAMFSGDTQGVTNDACPAPGSPYAAANIGRELLDAGKTFVGYSEDLPAVGSTVCSNGGYQRKHNPWSYFADVPTEANQPFSAFPTDFDQLPTVSYVVPNQLHDMHDGTIAQADQWLQTNLDAYAQWATTHNSILIVTWDEDDFTGDNHIATFITGARVKAGVVTARHDHYSLLRTLEDLYGTATHAGNAATAKQLDGCWS